MIFSIYPYFGPFCSFSYSFSSSLANFYFYFSILFLDLSFYFSIAFSILFFFYIYYLYSINFSYTFSNISFDDFPNSSLLKPATEYSAYPLFASYKYLVTNPLKKSEYLEKANVGDERLKTYFLMLSLSKQSFRSSLKQRVEKFSIFL